MRQREENRESATFSPFTLNLYIPFKDLDETPEKVTKTAKMVAGNAAHLAGLLRSSPYPG